MRLLLLAFDDWRDVQGAVEVLSARGPLHLESTAASLVTEIRAPVRLHDPVDLESIRRFAVAGGTAILALDEFARPHDLAVEVTTLLKPDHLPRLSSPACFTTTTSGAPSSGK